MPSTQGATVNVTRELNR